MLEAVGKVGGVPVRLAENEGIAFQGCIVLGLGFTLDSALAQEWIAADPRNAEVLFPYLNGEDLNSRPDTSSSRWVIDFGIRTEDEASSYPLPFERVRQLVKPERDKNKIAYRRDIWWRFAAWAPAMRRAIADLSEVLAIARISKTVMPLRISTGPVMNEKTVVFATASYGDQALLSSSLHWAWTIKYTSTMRTDINYSPSDVFVTLPRPKMTERLQAAGKALDSERRETMRAHGLGLTKLYNLVHDPDVTEQSAPDIAHLRDVHEEVDKAVMAAYGWSDVPLGHGFHTYRQMTRWTISPEASSEIVDRLLEENHRRARLEGSRHR